jgi:hypothetical protein
MASAQTQVFTPPQQQQPPPLTGTGFLAGQVVESPSGRPIPGATVTLLGRTAGRGGATAVVADSQGRFYFSQLPAGMYSFQSSKPGYTNIAAGVPLRTVTLAEAQRIVDLKVPLQKLVTISGSVRDETGDPVPATEVIVLRRELVNGKRVFQPRGRNRTDDRGMYRIINIPAGEYVVCACGREPIPFDGLLLSTIASQPAQLLGAAGRAVRLGSNAVSIDNTLRTYPPTFHPSSATVARATRVTLAPGDERGNVDVDVTSVRAMRVSGTAVGGPAGMTFRSIRLTPAAETDEAAGVTTMYPLLLQPDGRFDFAGVPPGQYVLRVLVAPQVGRGGNGPSGAAMQLFGNRDLSTGPAAGAPAGGGRGSAPALAQVMWASVPVAVGDEPITDIVLSIRMGAPISGKVQFVGNAPPPTEQAVLGRAGLLFSTLATDPDSVGIATPGRLNPDLTFTTGGAVPGRYFFSAQSLPAWPTVKSVTIGGVDVTDMTFELDENGVSDVLVTFSDAPLASVGGRVTGTRAAGAPPDESVVLFSADRRHWPEWPAARARFRRVALGTDDSFAIAGLPPGDYFIAVVSDAAAAEWQEAAKYEALARTATKIQIAEGEKKTVEVKR